MIARTYLCGKESIYFDRELVESLKTNMSVFWKYTYYYQSNWRVLHIDGREGFIFDPPILYRFSSSVTTPRFFQYAEEAA